MSSATTYEHSGRFGTTFLMLGPAVVVPAAFLLALIYNLGSIYIPIVGVFSVLLCGGYALGMALVLAWLVRFCRVRNTKLAVVAGLLTGGVALYASWAVFTWLFLRAQAGAPSLLEATMSPGLIWKLMGYLFREGWYSIGSGNANVTGWFLVVTWVVEAGILLVVPAALGLGTIADLVFCERCNRWADVKAGVIPALDPGAVMASLPTLAQGDLEPLAEIERISPTVPARCRLDVSHCPACKETSALSLVVETVTVDDAGKASSNEDKVLTNLLLSPEQFRYVMALPKAGPEPIPPEPAVDGDGKPEPQA